MFSDIPSPPKNTHEPINPMELFDLAGQLGDAADDRPDQKLTPEAIDEVARANETPRAHAWAALAVNPNLGLEMKSDTLFAICTGRCQGQGAVPLLEKLLTIRDQRVASGKKSFDIVPRHCLDLCDHAPVAQSRSPHGQAAHPKLKPENLEEIISTLCDS